MERAIPLLCFSIFLFLFAALQQITFETGRGRREGWPFAVVAIGFLVVGGWLFIRNLRRRS
jgi:hypothetical protein